MSYTTVTIEMSREQAFNARLDNLWREYVYADYLSTDDFVRHVESVTF